MWTWKAASVTTGFIALAIGLSCLYAAIKSPSYYDPGIYVIIMSISGTGGTIGGILGIAGGMLMYRNLRLACIFLLIAALSVIPFELLLGVIPSCGIMFFLIFMVSRNRARAYQAWEDYQLQAKVNG